MIRGFAVFLPLALIACGEGDRGTADPDRIKIVSASGSAEGAELLDELRGTFNEAAPPRDPAEVDLPPVDETAEPLDI